MPLQRKSFSHPPIGASVASNLCRMLLILSRAVESLNGWLQTTCRREHVASLLFLLDCFIYPPADFYRRPASKRLQKTSSDQCKAVKKIRRFRFKGSFFLRVQNLYLFLAQPNCLVHLDLSGTDCTVDSVCIQRLCLSLSTHHRLIASFNMGLSPETWKRRALNMNQLPRKNNVSSAESQAV